MINYLYRIFIKIHTIFKRIYHKAYIEVCKSRGLKLGEGVILIDTPDFGSEPYLVEIGSKTKITAGCSFITHDGAMYVAFFFQELVWEIIVFWEQALYLIHLYQIILSMQEFLLDLSVQLKSMVIKH